MDDGPKLYTHKPSKKALLKLMKKRANNPPLTSKSSPASASTPAAPLSTSSMGSSASAPASAPPPKQSFARRFKYLWPLLLTANFAVGAYILMGKKKEDTSIEVAAVSDVPATPVGSPVAPVGPSIGPVASVAHPVTPVIPVEAAEMPLASTPISLPVNQQRELFNWLLEEKRKLMPKDLEEKKRIDEDKAILKKFISAKSLPTF